MRRLKSDVHNLHLLKRGVYIVMNKQKILIVDDDENIAELVSLYLAKECFDTMTVHDGERALIAFAICIPIAGCGG